MNSLEKKIEEAMKEEFVGNIIFSDEELTTIYKKVGNELRKFDCTRGADIPTFYDKYMFIALVNIIKSWNTDGDAFWNFICKKLLGYNDSQKVYRYITSVVIERLGSSEAILFLDDFKKKYYATILVHAFAPLQSTEAFFDLCWQIYCEDLDLSYIPQDCIYEQAAKQLSRKLKNIENETDNFELGSHHYAFRAGIKGLAISNPERMAVFIETTVCYIDKLFNSGLIGTEKYYPRLLKNWWEQKEPYFGKIKKQNHERVVSDYKIIRPKYVLTDDTVYLCIPSIRLSDNLDIQPTLTVQTDSETITRRLYTKGTGLSMMTRQEQIDISKVISNTPFINITISIDHRGRNIYHSGQNLNRSFILFKDNREVYAQECVPGNYSLFLTDLDALYQHPKEINRISTDLFTFYAEENEVLQSSKRTVIFVDESKPMEMQFKMKRSDAVFCKTGEDYTVIDGEIWVAANAALNISEYGVRYEDIAVRLTEFTSKVSNALTYYSVTELLKVGEPQKLSVFRYSDNKIIAAINVIKFDNIDITYDKEIYYDSNNTGSVHFKTENFNETAYFNIAEEEILLPFKDGEIRFVPPVLKWKIDELEYHTAFSEKGIWYKNITNSSELTVELPPTVSCEIYLSGKMLLPNRRYGNNYWKLGEEIYSLISKPDCDKEILVTARLNNDANTEYRIVKIFMRKQFTDTPFYMSDNYHIIWDPKAVFKGEEACRFLLKLEQGQFQYVTTVLERDLTDEKTIIDLSGLLDGYYNVRIYTKPSNIFDCDSNMKELKKFDPIFIGNENQFKSNSKEFSKAFYVKAVKRGSTIYSRSFGSGKVNRIDGSKNQIICNFEAGEKRFPFPEVFLKGYLKFVK